MSWWLAVPLGALIVVGVAAAYVAGVVVFVWAEARAEAAIGEAWSKRLTDGLVVVLTVGTFVLLAGMMASWLAS